MVKLNVVETEQLQGRLRALGETKFNLANNETNILDKIFKEHIKHVERLRMKKHRSSKQIQHLN